ncbi:hypothetical protein GCM10027076_08470 [Nocardioides montaniterrae]
MVKLVVSTSALSRPVRVSLLLPVGYATTSRRYPVLYLLHGTSGGADSWLDHGAIRKVVGDRPLIVVMPDGGYADNGGGWWTDWADQRTPLGAANWEDFHIDELVPWVDAHLRTVAGRRGRAIAGLSQGGFGAFSYAARHPDLFRSAGSFSGAPDIARAPLAQVIGPFLVGTIASQDDGVEPFAPFGDPLSRRANWQGHNPASLVTNLRSTDLELWTGDGPAGSNDNVSAGTLATSSIESIVRASTLFFAQAARDAGVRYYLDDYGPGTHTWFYWHRDLTQYLPRLMRVFAHPGTRPATVTYTSIDKSYRQWGWQVAVNRYAAQAFTGFADASRSGLTWTGSSPATITTPPTYAGSSVHRVTFAGRTTTVRAGASGRLTLVLPGPPASHELVVMIS